MQAVGIRFLFWALRIAATSLRTGLAMTLFLLVCCNFGRCVIESL